MFNVYVDSDKENIDESAEKDMKKSLKNLKCTTNLLFLKC